MRTGAGAGEVGREGHESFLNFLQDFLLAFGAIALFVGAFVIANSLSITIAQRTRELATLRTLGASRRQVLVLDRRRGVRRSAPSPRSSGSSSASGSAKGLFKLFDAVGFTLPNNGLVLQTRTVVVALARRNPRHGPREPPSRFPRHARAADRGRARGRELPPGRFARFRPVGSALLTVAGFALLRLRPVRPRSQYDADPAFHGRRRRSLIFIGVALLAPARPAARLRRWAGRPRRFGGAAGTLARDNARRNPQRTASTASALMIGLALVTLVAVIAAGITKSFRGAVEQPLDQRLRDHGAEQLHPIPIAAGNAAAKTPGVRRSRTSGSATAASSGSVHQATAVESGRRADLPHRSGCTAAAGVLARLGATARSWTTTSRRRTT